jgi:hypothetical protein
VSNTAIYVIVLLGAPLALLTYIVQKRKAMPHRREWCAKSLEWRLIDASYIGQLVFLVVASRYFEVPGRSHARLLAAALAIFVSLVVVAANGVSN